MTWPTVAIDTTAMDAGTDSVATARAAVYDLAGKFNQAIAHVSTFMATVLDDTSASVARTTLDCPSTAGSGATGTWGISITGNAATAAAASGTSGFLIPRQDASLEGGQLDLARASDNTSYWHIDVYGATGSPTLRLIANATVAATLDTSGNFTATANVTAYSDLRLKHNIETIQNPLDKVLAMRGITYDRKDVEGRHTGLIAQDVLAVLPEAVITNADTGYLAVAYGNLVGLLVEAIKELNAEVKALKAATR